jgi:hypothetical protein
MQRPGAKPAVHANHLHVGRGFDEAPGVRLRRLLEHDAFGDFVVEVTGGPIEQAQRFGALDAVFRQKRRIGMQAFDMIDDGPESGDRASVLFDKNRQMRQDIFRRRQLAQYPLLGKDKPHQPARRRHQKVVRRRMPPNAY